MDISKWKLEIYDLLAIILPGLVIIGEGWVLVRGWEAFAATIIHLTGSGLTVLILAAFGAGTLVQELSDFLVKSCKGDRFFRAGRERFWPSTEAEPVKAARVSMERRRSSPSLVTLYSRWSTTAASGFPAGIPSSRKGLSAVHGPGACSADSTRSKKPPPCPSQKHATA